MYLVVLFSCSIMSNSLQPHGPHHTRLPYPFTISFTHPLSQSKLMSIESKPSNHLILCHLLFLLPSVFSSIMSFPMCWVFATRSQSIGALVSASVLPMNIQGLFPYGLTSLISLLSRGLSRVFSSTTFQKHQFFESIDESCWCLIIYCFELQYYFVIILQLCLPIWEAWVLIIIFIISFSKIL